ncbi:MAG: hypothetical protein C0617_09815 [Desulfuromonas sp.]|uniref:PilZ domain-containing protein n=1 Tax=Desulfuromonas sp. TaxID=892 RepID=UPI000CADE86B|nr:PilZ domain-containing protein [Desulfuromonas sp.]PLX83930.1 MAG: hypothetical protein C0617_09815 [Desulfuromonas sp.]
MTDEKRRFPRIATNVHVALAVEKSDKETRQYLEAVAENCSLGGMFIATDHLVPKGHIVRLKLQVDGTGGKSSVVHARGLVRRVQRWTKPKGIGVEFIEFEGLGEDSYADWAARLSGGEKG